MYQEFSLCSEKDFSVVKNFVVFSKKLLCSRKNCCVLEKTVAFSKRLLCFRREIELCFAPMGHRTFEILAASEMSITTQNFKLSYFTF